MLIAGIGCRRGCPADDIIALLRQAGALLGRSPDGLAAPDFKATEPGLLQASAQLQLRLLLVGPAALAAAQARCVTRSTTVLQHRGVASVAEGSALAAAGDTAQLRLARIAGPRATCAVAEAVP